jgi:hypothetical protein
VDVGERSAPEPSRIVGGGNGPTAIFGGTIEVEPPEGDTAEESDISAPITGKSNDFSEMDAPVTTIDSPNAMITKFWQRTAMWPPSMFQSVVIERPIPVVTKPMAGAR